METNGEIRLLLVDDHPLLRHGLRDVILRNPRFNIVGEAEDGQEALALIPALKPHTVILDIDMPRLNGLDTIRMMREQAMDLKIIILTMYREEDMFNAAMDLGAKAYVLKQNAVKDVLIALESVERGEIFVTATMLEAGRRRTLSGRAYKRTPIAPTPATVRAWAQSNGFEVPARGRIPKKVYEAFNKAS